jgi:hypothetical protein
MELLTRMTDGTVIVKHRGKYYLYYRLVGRSAEKPWVLVQQPDNGKIEWFKTEEELTNYIETL